MPQDWLKDAVFYEIYPQSFFDTNGDGIGDLNGIAEKLGYIRDLGCNALWINPCFDSPFKDAGYDVRDYKKVAERYGTNEDLYRLFEKAHAEGMHVFLDLVPGHTSEEHPWFAESGKACSNPFSGRYIWTDSWICGTPGHPYIGGECERDGTYMLNFFKCQPALNYGFWEPKEAWQQPMDSPDCLATREAVRDVMRFWLEKGCDGFRVDMADSLVKDDDADKTGTCKVWRDLLESLRRDFPEAAFVAEWSNPVQAIIGAGFDMDFYLDHWHNGYHTLLRDGEHSYFKKDGDGDIRRFLRDYLPKYEGSREDGYISFITGNHDTPRVSFSLDKEELKLAFAFLFTLPGVPFLYYGDEIGMRYQKELPTKEGGYTRTGSRTPMQWKPGKNLGFSDAEEGDLYLPVDDLADAPTVEAQMGEEESLYHTVKEILRLRHEEKALWADGEFEVLWDKDDKAFAYRRGNLVLALNPSGGERFIPMSGKVSAGGKTAGERIFRIGVVETEEGGIRLGAQSFVIFRT